MKNTIRIFVTFSFLLSLIINICSLSYANNLSVSNVSFGDRDPSNDTVVVAFDVSWENSWKTKINHDAIWLTVRLYNPAISPTEKKLCQISSSGLNPTGTSVGTATDFEIYVPSDQNGAFLRPDEYGSYESVTATDVQLTIDYASCGFTSSDTVHVSVLGVEMTLVPDGAFYAGDGTSAASLDQGSSDSDPWYINSESSIGVSNPTSNGNRYVSAGNSSENATGSVFTIGGSYPKGYAGFYAMKYEITEGQWVEFINSLGTNEARSNRDVTNGAHKNSDTVVQRNTIACSGTPLVCSTQRSSRAMGYLSWMDVAAFLDWAALRPMSELEFEKMARGPLQSVSGEFAWGTIDLTGITALSGSLEDGSETVSNSGANAHYNNVTLTGGDSSNGAEYALGPIRPGIFATSSTSRSSAASGYYGNMDLSGNVRERVVTLGNASGRNFSGSHGNGILSSVAGYEGNATNADWPGIDAEATRGVTGADGSGFKGGGYDDQSSGARLRISDRQDAAFTSTLAYSNSGGRGVRTYEE